MGSRDRTLMPQYTKGYKTMWGSEARRRANAGTASVEGKNSYDSLNISSRRPSRAFVTAAVTVALVLAMKSAPYMIRQVVQSYSIMRGEIRGEWMVEELPNDLAFLDARLCEQNPSIKRCGQADIIYSVQGNLGARLYSMCVADAFSQASESKLRVLWLQDLPVRHARFEDLIVSPELDVQHDLDEFKAPPDYHEKEVQSPVCMEPSTENLTREGQKQRRLHDARSSHNVAMPPVTLLVAPWLRDWSGWLDPPACALHREMRRCLRQLQPGETVEDLMVQENMPRLRRSIAVYVQAAQPSSDQLVQSSSASSSLECSGCPDGLLPNCTIRRLTMDFLRDPTLDFSVGAHWAAHAVAVSHSFVAERAPLLFSLTADRSDHCPGPPKLPPVTRRKDGRYSQRAKGVLGARRRAELAGGLGTEESRIWTGKNQKGREHRWRPQKDEPQRADVADRDEVRSRLEESVLGSERGGTLSSRLRVKLGLLDARKTGRRRLLEEMEYGPLDEGLKALQSIRCLQYQLAELFLLSYARGLLFAFPSPETEFMHARMRPNDAAFQSEPSICESPQIQPITKQRFAAQMFVDEDRKAIYCSIPKVACTSWKVWFRQVAGLPHPEDTWIAHDPAKSGLKELWWSYSEPEAIRVLTRPDMFRFTFTRNPMARLLSVYLDKHVNGGPPYTRQHWNKKFFGSLLRMSKPQERNRELGLETFLDLVKSVMETQRDSIEPHIAPQVDLCNLATIKYDFVGRFENLEEDVAEVMARLGTKPMSAFSLGRKAHPTQAETRMLAHFNQIVYDVAKDVYKVDFRIPFNNISYEPPQVLARLYESASST